MKHHRAINGGNDKYYTKQWVADYLSHLMLERYPDGKFIEPTAGSGAFLNVINNIEAYDLYPEDERITKKDALELEIPEGSIVIGNPPFGTSGSLAIAIFNALAKYKPKAFGFILPKTFRKKSVQDRLDRNYHLVMDIEIPESSFEVEGTTVCVPCTFQIWEWRKKERQTKRKEDCQWIEFTTKEKADIAVRRVGGRSGQILEGLDHSKTSTYFIKLKEPDVAKALRLMDLSCVENTAGVRSISKEEICSEVNRIMQILKDKQ